MCRATFGKRRIVHQNEDEDEVGARGAVLVVLKEERWTTRRKFDHHVLYEANLES